MRLVSRSSVSGPHFGGGVARPPRRPAPHGHRRANLGRGFEETSIYRGPELIPGDCIAAPGIIEETFTTIVVYPGWEARVDDAGDYLLERAS